MLLTSTFTSKQEPHHSQQQFKSGNSVSWVTACVVVMKTSYPNLLCIIPIMARETEESQNHHTRPTSPTSSSQPSTSSQLRRRYENYHKTVPDGEASSRPPAISNLPEGTKSTNRRVKVYKCIISCPSMTLVEHRDGIGLGLPKPTAKVESVSMCNNI